MSVGDRQAGEDVVHGAKAATIMASAVYPVVSAHEFEFLKTEAAFRERLDHCTVYLIVQRPLTYFDNVRLDDTFISLDIVGAIATVEWAIPQPC